MGVHAAVWGWLGGYLAALVLVLCFVIGTRDMTYEKWLALFRLPPVTEPNTTPSARHTQPIPHPSRPRDPSLPPYPVCPFCPAPAVRAPNDVPFPCPRHFVLYARMSVLTHADLDAVYTPLATWVNAVHRS